MAGINLHIYPSPIQHESRMLKETDALAKTDLFEEIHLVGIQAAELAATERLDSKRLIVRIPCATKRRGTLGRMIAFLKFKFSIIIRYLRSPITAVSCHCLAVLPLGVAFKAIKGSKLIYEAHELETERHGWTRGQRLAAKVLERCLIPFVDRTIVVGPSIERWYRKRYGLDSVCTVRNIPSGNPIVHKTPILRTRFNIPDSSLLFIYQGVFGYGRGLELLINVFRRLPNCHVVFLGFGPLESEIKSASSEHSNIHFHEALPPGEIGPYTAGADVGLALFENTSLSYYYSCPNKLFEYILNGVPVIASNFPDMAAIIDEFKCGWKTEVSAESLYELLKTIDQEALREAAQGAFRSSTELGWEHEALVLVDAYRGVLLKESGQDLPSGSVNSSSTFAGSANSL